MGMKEDACDREGSFTGLNRNIILHYGAFLYCIIIILVWRISNIQKERKEYNQPLYPSSGGLRNTSSNILWSV